MTVTTRTQQSPIYVGDGTKSTYSFAFPVFRGGVLKVTVADDKGEESTPSFYEALNPNQTQNPGGTISLPTPLAAGWSLVIEGYMDSTQDLVLRQGGAFYPQDITNAFDKLTILYQVLNDKIRRAPLAPVTQEASSFTAWWRSVLAKASGYADAAATSASTAGVKASNASAASVDAAASASKAKEQASVASERASNAQVHAAESASSAESARQLRNAAYVAADAAGTALANVKEAAESFKITINNTKLLEQYALGHSQTARTLSELASASADVAAAKASEAGVRANASAASALTSSAKASEASASANLVLSKVSEASASATTAIAKASEAQASGTLAATKASEASVSANAAAAGALTSATKASEASGSAAAAATSATAATQKAAEAASVIGSVGALRGARGLKLTADPTDSSITVDADEIVTGYGPGGVKHQLLTKVNLKVVFSDPSFAGFGFYAVYVVAYLDASGSVKARLALLKGASPFSPNASDTSWLRVGWVPVWAIPTFAFVPTSQNGLVVKTQVGAIPGGSLTPPSFQKVHIDSYVPSSATKVRLSLCLRPGRFAGFSTSEVAFGANDLSPQADFFFVSSPAVAGYTGYQWFSFELNLVSRYLWVLISAGDGHAVVNGWEDSL